MLFFSSNGRYDAQIGRERQRQRACQIKTSYSDVVAGQKEVGRDSKRSSAGGNKPTVFVWGDSEIRLRHTFGVCWSRLLRANLLTSTCSSTDDLHCPVSVCFHSVSSPCDFIVHLLRCSFNPHGRLMWALWSRVTWQRGFICWDC